MPQDLHAILCILLRQATLVFAPRPRNPPLAGKPWNQIGCEIGTYDSSASSSCTALPQVAKCSNAMPAPPDRPLNITNSTSSTDLFSANNLIQGPGVGYSAAALLGLARRCRA